MNVGVMGAGFIGTVHVNGWNTLSESQVTAVLEQNTEKAEKIASITDAPVFRDMDEFLDSGLFDAADICLPTFLHKEAIRKSLDAGCHVLCEKPLALSKDEGIQIQKLVLDSGKIFMVAQVIRFWPQYITIKEYIDNGSIGSIESVHAYRFSESPLWGEWFRDPEKSGGALFDLHIHDVDFVYSLLGAPTRVQASGARGPSGSWDTVSALFDYGAASAVVEGGSRFPDGFPFRFGIMVSGSNGFIEYHLKVGSGNVESKGEAQESFLFIDRGTGEAKQLNASGDGYENELRYFAECVSNNTTPKQATIKDAVAVLDIIEREKICLESGD